MSLSASMWKSLFECCRDAKTGSLFIATKENKAGQVVVKDGILVGIAYAGLCNHEAVEKLESVGELRFSFTPGVQFPLKETLTEEASAELLQAMGYEAPAIEPLEEASDAVETQQPEEAPASLEVSLDEDHHDALWETAKAGTVERLYRGHKILKDPEIEHPTERFYRGQRVVA